MFDNVGRQDNLKDISGVIVLPASRNEFRRIFWIPEPCSHEDSDILNIHFAVMDLLTEDSELAVVFKNTLSIEMKLKVLNASTGVWSDLPSESKVNIPGKTNVQVILTSPDPIGPIRSLPPRSGGVRRDPRKKPGGADVGPHPPPPPVNKRDPRRKNLDPDNKPVPPPSHPALPGNFQNTASSQLYFNDQNQVANQQFAHLQQPQQPPEPPPRPVNRRDPRKKNNLPPHQPPLPPLPPPPPLPTPSVTQAKSIGDSSNSAQQPASTEPKFVSKKDPRLRRQQAALKTVEPAKAPDNKASNNVKEKVTNRIGKVSDSKNDEDESKKGLGDQLLDIIKNRSTLSVLSKPKIDLQDEKEIIHTELHSSPSPPLEPVIPDNLYNIPDLPDPVPTIEEPLSKVMLPPPLPSSDVASAPVAVPVPAPPPVHAPLHDHDDSDSEGELQIDMGSQDAKRRISQEEYKQAESKPSEAENICAEDLLEEMYGAFDKDEPEESLAFNSSSQSSPSSSNTNKILAKGDVEESDGDDTPEILSPVPVDYKDTSDDVLTAAQKSCEQLEREQLMLANLEKERDRLNAIVEESSEQQPGPPEKELEEGEISDTDEEEEEEGEEGDDSEVQEVCEDESPQSPEASQIVISGDTPGEIPLDRLESDGEASEVDGEEEDGSDIEIVHEGQKEFRKYWEDFDEETSGAGVGVGEGEEDGREDDYEPPFDTDENLSPMSWTGADPLFKRRGELSPGKNKQHVMIDDSCGLYSRRTTVQKQPVAMSHPPATQPPPPPLINPALVASTVAGKDPRRTSQDSDSSSLAAMSKTEEASKKVMNRLQQMAHRAATSREREQELKDEHKESNEDSNFDVEMESAVPRTPPREEEGGSTSTISLTSLPSFGSLHADSPESQYKVNMMANLKRPGGPTYDNTSQREDGGGGELKKKRRSILGAPPTEEKSDQPMWEANKYQTNSTPAFQTDMSTSKNSIETFSVKLQMAKNDRTKQIKERAERLLPGFADNSPVKSDTSVAANQTKTAAIPKLMDIDVSDSAAKKAIFGSSGKGVVRERKSLLGKGPSPPRVGQRGAVPASLLGRANMLKRRSESPGTSSAARFDRSTPPSKERKTAAGSGGNEFGDYRRNDRRSEPPQRDGQRRSDTSDRRSPLSSSAPSSRGSRDSREPYRQNQDRRDTGEVKKSRSSRSPRAGSSSKEDGSSKANKRSPPRRASRSRSPPSRRNDRTYDEDKEQTSKNPDSRYMRATRQQRVIDVEDPTGSKKLNEEKANLMLKFYEGHDMEDFEDPGDPDDFQGEKVEPKEGDLRQPEGNKGEKEKEKPRGGLVNFLKSMKNNYNLSEEVEGKDSDSNTLSDIESDENLVEGGESKNPLMDKSNDSVTSSITEEEDQTCEDSNSAVFEVLKREAQAAGIKPYKRRRVRADPVSVLLEYSKSVYKAPMVLKEERKNHLWYVHMEIGKRTIKSPFGRSKKNIARKEISMYLLRKIRLLQD